jgi:hypothetical protein
MFDTLGKIFELYGGDSSCVDFASVSGSGEVNEVGVGGHMRQTGDRRMFEYFKNGFY